MEEAIVDTLIDFEARSWNYGMIDVLFALMEVEIIKHIPLFWIAMADSL